MTTAPLRILLADDHPVFRHGLSALLASTPGLEIVGEANTGEEAVAAAARLSPDVIVIDLSMPGIGGIEATRRILARNPQVNVLALTMHDDDASLHAAIRAGARGYVVKGADRDTVVRAVHAVAAGEAILGPGVSNRLLALGDQSAAEPFPQLTARERSILELLATGQSNGEIARALNLSPKTVRNNASTIFTKLEVSDRGRAIIKAREAGLGER